MTTLPKTHLYISLLVVKALIEKGVNKDITDKDGKEPIGYAIPNSKIYNLNLLK